MDIERKLARHKDAVYRQLLRMCGNHDDAEDVFSEAMVSAYNASGSLRDEGAFRAWLVQIGRRACGRLKKREALRPGVALEALQALGIEFPSDEASPEQQALESELKNCVMTALEGLPETYRAVYVLAEIEGLTMQETADRLGITVANTKVRLHRSRAMLRKAIDAQLGCL
jgi:RNA polymerase sigma-70 factor (ECF subfamily)